MSDWFDLDQSAPTVKNRHPHENGAWLIMPANNHLYYGNKTKRVYSTTRLCLPVHLFVDAVLAAAKMNPPDAINLSDAFCYDIRASPTEGMALSVLKY